MSRFSKERLQNFPVTFFASVMGLSGYSLVLNKLSATFGFSAFVPQLVAFATLTIYLCITYMYLSKLRFHPEAFKKNDLNPHHLGFIATASVGTILVSTAIFPYSEGLARGLWSVGALVHLGLMLRTVSVWINNQEVEVLHTNPSWFIPVVGSFLVPIIGVQIAPVEISWFFFSVGVLFWIVLLAIVFYRIIYHNTLDQNLIPTLFVLMAPPSVGMLAWYNLVGELDALVKVFYFIGLFMLMVALTQIKLYMQLRSFSLSWWTFSFPLAAFILATFTMAKELDSSLLLVVGSGLSVFLNLIVAMLVWKTLESLFRGELVAPVEVPASTVRHQDL